MADVHKKILIVDDEEALARAVELQLGSLGFDTKAVFDGDEAIDVLNNEHFDLMVLDLAMPKVDGLTVMRSILEKKDKPIIIVLSNSGHLDTKQRALELGAVEYFVKAETPLDKLSERIAILLRSGK